jgi:hypothetical protein
MGGSTRGGNLRGNLGELVQIARRQRDRRSATSQFQRTCAPNPL